MTNIVAFLPREVPPIEVLFDPDSLMRIGEAFDQVCGRLQVGEEAGFVKEAIAVHIIALARSGSRDPKWLCNTTLMALEKATSLP
jgi:hypothetical protein